MDASQSGFALLRRRPPLERHRFGVGVPYSLFQFRCELGSLILR